MWRWTCLLHQHVWPHCKALPAVRDSSNPVISQQDWWVNLRYCVHLICCLLLQRWNGAAIKGKKPLAAVTSQGLYLVIFATLCSLSPSSLCWFIEISGVLLVVFSHGSRFDNPHLPIPIKLSTRTDSISAIISKPNPHRPKSNNLSPTTRPMGRNLTHRLLQTFSWKVVTAAAVLLQHSMCFLRDNMATC